MTTHADLEKKFWKALQSDRTLMLGLDGVDSGRTRPMTAQFEHDRGPIWFFTSRDNQVVQRLSEGNRAIAAFTAKNHSLFATISGTLHQDDDRTTIDRLWNPFIAAWYDGGKDDPNLALLRLDTDGAEVWLNENNLLAGVKLLMGMNPTKDYQDKTGTVNLR